jgi:uncharacterized membrane protein
MSNTRLPNSLFFVLALVATWQYAYYSPRLPEVLASHFAANGAVNGWQSKSAFFSVELAIVILAGVVGFGIPQILGALPVSLINLPNKEFWFSAERRDETLSYMRACAGWFGCALLAFLLFVMELAFRANLHTPPRFDNAAFIPALLAFMAFDTIVLLRMILHFAKTQKG